MTQLDDDLDTIRAAATAAERQAAIVQWLADATPVIDLLVDRQQKMGFALRFLKRLELKLLSTGMVWNPERLSELRDEPDN